MEFDCFFRSREPLLLLLVPSAADLSCSFLVLLLSSDFLCPFFFGGLLLSLPLRFFFSFFFFCFSFFLFLCSFFLWFFFLGRFTVVFRLGIFFRPEKIGSSPYYSRGSSFDFLLLFQKPQFFPRPPCVTPMLDVDPATGSVLESISLPPF